MSTARLDRRQFVTLATGGVTGLAVGSAASRLAFATPEHPAIGDVLVCVFLRGGADGMSLVPPVGDGHYYDMRPNLAVPPPDRSGGALDLNGFFGLHPALAPLYNGAWTDGHLAIVNGVGLPESTPSRRSHFEAQDHWERGATSTGVRSGWLGRHLGVVGAGGGVPGATIDSSLATAFAGARNAVAIRRLDRFQVQGFPSDQVAAIQAGLGQLYRSGSGLVNQVASATLNAVSTVAATNPSRFGAQNGAVYPNGGVGRDLHQIAQLIRAGVGLQAAVVDVGGWDTHDDQGTSIGGALAGRIDELGRALHAFYTDLGPLMDEVTLVTNSEFGRSTEENGSGGTDHGWGSTMFAMGRGIRGGIYGEWPDISDTTIDRDLTVTVDFRTVLGEIVTQRLANTDLDRMFPGFVLNGVLGLAR